MGRKHIVPYALYRTNGFISPSLARQTKFTRLDLEHLWEALWHMFEFDRSAARGLMSTQALYIFEHSSELGNAPAHKLFEAITVRRKDGSTGPARAFSDYTVHVDRNAIPSAVRLVEYSSGT
jgi:CRISPR-associated protein Csd2